MLNCGDDVLDLCTQIMCHHASSLCLFPVFFPLLLPICLYRAVCWLREKEVLLKIAAALHLAYIKDFEQKKTREQLEVVIGDDTK